MARSELNSTLLLAIDQGTSSTRAMAFRLDGTLVAAEQQPLPQIYPAPGWVEHDPEVIWATVLSTARAVLQRVLEQGCAVAAIGITNQRETTLVWDRRTGVPLHNAIVWQDRRTAPHCRELIDGGHEPALAASTGLCLDPYFSATKLDWLLGHVAGAREAARAGRLAFGTIDSFLLWRLTGGRVHATDATNASRTALYDIVRGAWDPALCELFGVPAACLPEVRDCAGDFGATDPALFGRAIPIRGIAGDQQAALVGQAALAPGEVKSTYGTGAFLVLNTGSTPVRSSRRLLTTIAYRLAGRTTYALEGSVLSAGSVVQWLRDGLGIVARAEEIETLAASTADTGGVYLVPAFTGLGAPYWDPDARAALLGLTRASGRAEIARAGLDCVAYQTGDLLEAMAADGVRPTQLKVDGGMARNGLFLQRLADLLDVPIVRPRMPESTALGAALLAGLGAGLYPGPEALASVWQAEARFTPQLAPETRRAQFAGWRAAVARVRSSSMG